MWHIVQSQRPQRRVINLKLCQEAKSVSHQGTSPFLSPFPRWNVLPISAKQEFRIIVDQISCSLYLLFVLFSNGRVQCNTLFLFYLCVSGEHGKDTYLLSSSVTRARGFTLELDVESTIMDQKTWALSLMHLQNGTFGLTSLGKSRIYFAHGKQSSLSIS